MIKWDGHTHTRFCYHGNDAIQELYLDRAIELGFERYTMSEHPPVPLQWIDDKKLWDELAMPAEELPDYMAYAKEMKRRYEGKIEVTVGLELDYLPGQLDFTERIVDKWHKDLEDVVYSVHYLPGVGGNRCMDYTADDFKLNILPYYGTMENVVNEYYDRVEAAIEWTAQLPMRKRIGHINLIEKFQSELPPIDETLIKRRLEGVLPLLVKSNVGIDVNIAGLRVPTCGKPYVPEWFITECRKLEIPCVYGSDSHKPDQVGLGWDWYSEQMRRPLL
ncbi:histidinol-phosphatase HisJ [Paenibacillus sp. GSMTC-2017]|uniref:histidinol-phosphatase HisJ n=1 Tax=Paenibacillus sp. GSMTC-2017 TaxID=2794350 RepID=UPI0018D75A31|nr:histidinol-phosphatase HisJ [Paenibacillus sp. GSMTC-2017]MBH5319935.1 histidinol-phosphatase HisJ [Paenibacillus sp. GSMTC-2017]